MSNHSCFDRFVGDFTEEGLIDDLSGLEDVQLAELDSWYKFYEAHETYTKV